MHTTIQPTLLSLSPQPVGTVASGAEALMSFPNLDPNNTLAQQQINASVTAPDAMVSGMTYVVKQHEKNKQKFYRLEPMADYTIPKVVYGDTHVTAERIIRTFLGRDTVTGVLLAGEAGSGKTLLAKYISLWCHRLGLPTVIVSDCYYGSDFNLFIKNLPPCVVIWDEFDKSYDTWRAQPALLSLFEGIFSSKKLFILTCNEIGLIDQRFINRPGRIYFCREYKGLNEDFITEYCEDNLDDTTQIRNIIKIANRHKSFSYDMLQALVEAMNMWKEPADEAIRLLNIKPRIDVMYAISLNIDGVDIATTDITPPTIKNPSNMSKVVIRYMKDNMQQTLALKEDIPIKPTDNRDRVYAYEDEEAKVKITFTRVREGETFGEEDPGYGGGYRRRY